MDKFVLARPMCICPSSATAGNDPASLNALAEHSCMFLNCDGKEDQKSAILNGPGGGKSKALTNRKGSLKIRMKRSLNSIRESGRGVKRCQPTFKNGSVQIQNSSEHGFLSDTNMKENTLQAVKFTAKGVIAEKSGAAILKERFKDVPAMVPIKKRKIHMIEDTRSPSPTPRLLSPGMKSPLPSFPSLSFPLLSDSLTSPSGRMSSGRMSSLSSQPPKSPSPRLLSPESRSVFSSSPASPSTSSSPRSSFLEARSLPFSHQASSAGSPSVGSAYPGLHDPPNLVSWGCELNAEPGKLTVNSSGISHFNQVIESNKQGLAVQPLLLSNEPSSPTIFSDNYNRKIVEEEEEEAGVTSVQDCSDIQGLDMAVESGKSARVARTNGALEESSQDMCHKGMQRTLDKSTSGLSVDDRSHWDLNMEMELWERLPVRTASTEVEGKTSSRFPCPSVSIDSNESNHYERAVKLQANDVHETEKCVDLGTSVCRDEVDQSLEAGETMSKVLYDESNWKAEGATGQVDFDKPALWKGDRSSDVEANEKSWMEQDSQKDAQDGFMTDVNLEKGPTSLRTKAEGQDESSREVDVEENVDYGDLEWRDVDDAGLDFDEKASAVLQAGTRKAVWEIGNLHASSTPREVDTVSNEDQEKSGLCEEGLRVSCCNSQLSETSFGKDGNSGRSKPTGWDQLPESSENVEEAWKVVKENSSHNVRGRPWTSLHRLNPVFISQGTRRGRRPGSEHPASRVSFESVRGERFSRDPVHHDQRLYYGTKSFDRGNWMENGRKRRSKFTYVRDYHSCEKFGGDSDAHFHDMSGASTWRESGGSTGKWHSGRGHANAAAAAAAKVESSGFVVAPDGTITKAGGGFISRRRGGTQSMSAGWHGSNCRPTNTRKGHGDLETAMNNPARVHVWPGRGWIGKSPKVGMKREGRDFEPNAWQDNVIGTKETGKLVGGWRHQRPLFRSVRMEHERRESPDRFFHPSDHFQKHNHTSPSFRPDFKVERANTSHIHLFHGHSKLVSTRVAAGQVSSPPKQSVEVEAVMPSGQEIKQASPCPQFRTTSSDVAYGCPSMEERDEQILSEAQCSSSLRAGLNSAISAGKFGNCSPEIRGLTQNEDDAVRIRDSKLRERDENRTSLKEYDNDKLNTASLSKRNVLKQKDRWRDSNNSPLKDGRSVRSGKRVSAWEEDDDVAPRRRRLS